MTWDLIGFEWRYHSRQISFAAACLLFFVFGFVLTATGFGPANLNVNSPYSIMQTIGVLSLMSVFVLAVFNANAVLRDREYRMEEIVFSTAVEKLQFLSTRFAGSFLAATTAFSVSVLGMIAATLLPGQDPDRLGALQPLHYLWALLVLAAPNILFAAATLFAIAVITRSLLASSVGAVLLYVLYFAASAWSNSPLMAASAPGARESLPYASLLDPFGLSAFFEQARYWTPDQRNSQLTRLSGAFLWNRLVWIGAAGALFGAVYQLFSFRLLNESGKKLRAAVADVEGKGSRRLPYSHVPVLPSSLASYRSALAIELHSYLRTLPFLALTLLWVALAASEIASTVGSGEYGSRVYPTASLMLSAIQRPLHLVALVIIIYYSAELVWRERTVRIDGIIGATPASSSVFILAKWSALTALISVVILAGSLVAVLFAFANGFAVDPAVVAAWAWFGGVPLLLFATLALLVQTISPHKYVGMLVVLLLAMLMEAGTLTGLQHHLWHFGSAPAITWSHMNGFGPSARAFNWYMLHWAILGALFLVLATAMWRKGGSSFRSRRVRLTLAALSVLALLSGAHILFNTTVLNDFTTSAEQKNWQADYERKYSAQSSMPQPRIASVQAAIDLYPERRRYVIRGSYLLRNEAGRELNRLMVSVPRSAKKVKISAAGARLLEDHDRFGTSVLELDRPLGQHETTRLSFELSFENRGFRDDGPDTTVVENGSFALGSRYLPMIGYRSSYELTRPHERRRHGLPARTDEPDETEEDAAGFDQWAQIDMTLSTPLDQIAVTTGRLQREWVKDGRRFRHYRSDGPVANAVAFSAARYKVAAALYDGVSVEVFHHPQHAYNVERMLLTARDALRHFADSFGPYPHRQLKIVEVAPSGFSGMARPDTIFLGETRAFLIDSRRTDLDLVSRRTVHEIAHQWWGLHLVPAPGPGATVLTESLTKYAELMLLRRAGDVDAVRRSLTYELDLYLSGRAADTEPELPLAKAGAEPYLYYRKGALVMNAIAELLGEERFHRALRTLMENEGGPGRLPTTTHLMNHLRHQASPEEQQLIGEWMNGIVLYGLKVESAVARPEPDGSFRVTIRVDATKSEGARTLPLNEDLEIAIFAGHPDRGDSKTNTLYLAKHRLHSGANEISVVVNQQPAFVAVDPDLLRIDDNRVDNLRPVTR